MTSQSSASAALGLPSSWRTLERWRAIVLDHPLANGQNEVLVRLKKKAGRTKIPVPEQFVMMIAETDIEDLD